MTNQASPVTTRILATCLALVFLLSSCGTGSQQLPPTAQSLPADPDASAEARAVQAYLAALSNDTIPGVIAGQNTGHGNQILDATGLVGYAPLVGALEQQTGEVPGMLGLDYEQDHVFTPAELSTANQVLIGHWHSGGLVTINWSPLNPWLNDESNIAGHPGLWTDTRNMNNNLAGVDLRQLVDPQSKLYPVWRRKLERVATALGELQAAGVVVLWRPMQEMNGNWFWWGNATTSNDSGPYIAIWRDMFQYFTKEKGLHNLLWVYSPAASNNILEQFVVRPAGWAYPGDAYVDVVAGTSYNDALDVNNYQAFQSFGKPIGIGEFGPALGGQASLNGTFDTTLYARRLQKDYPAVAYWVSWHNWQVSAGVQEHQAIVSNQNAQKLMQDPAVITLSRLGWQK